jgi:Mor family transcriptional regulator
MTPNHPVVALLGHKHAYTLASQFGGDQIILPRCVAAMRALRDTTIREQRSGGASTKTLALKHGLTERQIYAILAGREEQASPQQSLL